MRPMKWHESITAERVLALVQVDDLTDPGICTSCGQDAYGVEGDARQYPCESCGKRTVYGAQELLLMMGG